MADIAQLYYHMHSEYAIRGEVKQKLPQILPLLNKTRLSVIAGAVNLPGRSKMNKLALAEAMPPYILDASYLEEALLLANEKESRIYQELMHGPYVQKDNLAPGYCFYFMEKGLLFSFLDEDKLFFLIPEEVRKLLHQLDWKAFQVIRDRHQQVLRYIHASVHLYGICKPELLLDLFNKYNDEKLDMPELLQIADFHSQRAQTYRWIKGYLASDYFDSEPQGFDELLRNIHNKPRYIPSKEEFLNYADDHYFEMTPQLRQLRLFMQQFSNKPVLVDDLLDDIQLLCSLEEPLQMVFNEVERRGIEFSTMEQVKRFTHLIVEVYNHTRLWSNCGHTPAELSALSGGSGHRVIPGQRIVPAKIGRNDPCPCGSGQKYKKCCGK